MKSSAINKPDERLVYLALRSVFIGEDAKIRTMKTIRKQVQKHQQKEDVKALMNNHNEDHVYSTAKELLEDHVFESTVRAKLRFPEVFSISPAQSADREQSEEEAAKSEENAIKNAAEGRVDNHGPIRTGDEVVCQGRKRMEFETETSYKHKHQHQKFPLPALYPTYLPFETQHRLMVKAQNIIEVSCYTFAAKSLTGELEKNGWDCPERVELHIWSRAFRNVQFPDESISALGKPLEDLLESMAHLRHTAVHRIEISVNRILEFLIDSERMATLLEDENAATRIKRLRGTLELAIDEIKRNKEFLNFRATETVRDLDDKIAELKRLQEAAVVDMLDEDKTFLRLAVADLEIVMDVKASKQRDHDSRECKALSEIKDVIESSSDVGVEGEKQCNFG